MVVSLAGDAGDDGLQTAKSYRKLIDYFEPWFFLGLTATPERTDGGDLLALCGENLVYRCDLVKRIRDTFPFS